MDKKWCLFSVVLALEFIVMTLSKSYSKQLFQKLRLTFIFIYTFGTTKLYRIK